MVCNLQGSNLYALSILQILVLKSDSEVNTTEVEEAQEANWDDAHALRLGGGQLQWEVGGFAAHLMVLPLTHTYRCLPGWDGRDGAILPNTTSLFCSGLMLPCK